MNCVCVCVCVCARGVCVCVVVVWVWDRVDNMIGATEACGPDGGGVLG